MQLGWYKPTKTTYPGKAITSSILEPIHGRKPSSTTPSFIINLYFYVCLPFFFVGLDWVYEIYFFILKCCYWCFVSFFLLSIFQGSISRCFLAIQLTFSVNVSFEKIMFECLHLIPTKIRGFKWRNKNIWISFETVRSLGPFFVD